MSQFIIRPSATAVPLRVVWATLVREWWVNLRAYRISFFVAVLLNSLFTLLIGYFLYRVVFAGHVTKQFVADSGVPNYLSYLTLGVVAYNFAFRLLYPVRNLLFEQWEGTLQPLILAGVPLLWYQVGCIAFSAVYSVLESGILLAIVWPFAGLDLAHA
ncbi:ABC-2 type transporter, partial [mine drainage metagenome]